MRSSYARIPFPKCSRLTLLKKFFPSSSQPVEEIVRWSEVPQAGSAPSSLPPPSPSHSSTSSLSSNDSSREATPAPASETPGNHLPHPTTTDDEPQETTNGPKHSGPPPPPQAVVTSALVNGHMRYESIDEQMVEEDVPVPFCDCPPDPEIPRHIVLHQLRLVTSHTIAKPQ